jgi:hypothetical protein
MLFYYLIIIHFKRKLFIYIKYRMPKKINMFLLNGSQPTINFIQNNTASLAGVNYNPSMSSSKAPTALNAPILARVHNVRPGCGSCGRH